MTLFLLLLFFICDAVSMGVLDSLVVSVTQFLKKDSDTLISSIRGVNTVSYRLL